MAFIPWLPKLICVFGLFFFFQAEDGIRDYKVTGVQTCALPIWPPRAPGSSSGSPAGRGTPHRMRSKWGDGPLGSESLSSARSEERRVGKERRSRWAPDQ